MGLQRLGGHRRDTSIEEEYAAGKGGAVQVEGGEEMLDTGLLFPFFCFVVILSYLWCFWKRGCSSCFLFFPEAYCAL